MMQLSLFPELENKAIKPSGVLPFIPWIGGKRRIINEILSHFPTNYNRYYKPFLGGGAIFFALNPTNAFVSDGNWHLIEAYKAVKYYPTYLMERLDDLDKYRTKEEFIKIRQQDRLPEFKYWHIVDKAARFIYLVKRGVASAYRINRQGFCTTSPGTEKKYHGIQMNKQLYFKDTILQCHDVLNKNDVFCHDFQAIELTIKKNDFVYLDPPYFKSKVDYNGFSCHERVKSLCLELDRKGVKFLLSNSEEAEGLYKDFKVTKIIAPRQLYNGLPATEILVQNY